jgi:hypothetical protein
MSLGMSKRYGINWKFPGRMLSMTKHSPEGHVCVWNANVCTKSKGKIWYGDIDLTDDADDLRNLATSEGEDVYVLREMDGRFYNEQNPKFENAVALVDKNGVTICHV